MMAKGLGVFDIPVGIPSTFEPRPNPFITGPPMKKGSIGKVPSIPEITNQKLDGIGLPWKGK